MKDTQGYARHDHFTHLYSDRREQFDTVVPYVREGLDAGEKCVYVASDHSPQAVLDELAAGGIDVDAALDAGDLDVYDSREVFPEDAVTDADRLLDILEAAVEGALAAGYDRVRTTGEMAWLADHGVDHSVAEEFEARLNDRCPEYPWVILCQYHREDFPPSFVDDVLHTHPQLLRESERVPNEHYRGPGAPEPTAERVDRKLERAFRDAEGASSVGDRTERLAALSDATERFLDADADDIRRLAVETAEDALDAAHVSLWTLDDDTGRLGPRAADSTGDATGPVSEREDVVWTALEEDASQQFQVDPDDASARSGVAAPLGSHGVLVAADPSGLSDVERTLFDVLAANARNALEKREAEAALAERNAALSDSTTRAERLDRMTTAFRDVSRVVVDGATREEILAAVCDRLTDIGSAQFAWVGSFDPVETAVAPEHSAGDDQGYLDALRTASDWVDSEPTGRAAQTRTVETVTHLRPDPPLPHWQKQALERGVRSVVSAPLVYDGFRYGVLSVYSDAPGTFDDEVAAVVGQLGDLVAYALAAIERKRSLVNDGATELRLLVSDDANPAVDLVDAADCRVELDGVSVGDDGAVRCFVTVAGADPGELRAAASRAQDVEDLSPIGDTEDGHRYECRLAASSVVGTLLEHGAVPTEFVAEDGRARVTVRVPREWSVREFLALFREAYPGAELLARRECEPPLRSGRDPRSLLEDTLSSRQLEILETAYFSGYFEWPRERTGEEVADSLGVTQPTVNRHLRAAQRELFSTLLEED